MNKSKFYLVLCTVLMAMCIIFVGNGAKGMEMCNIEHENLHNMAIEWNELKKKLKDYESKKPFCLNKLNPYVSYDDVSNYLKDDKSLHGIIKNLTKMFCDSIDKNLDVTLECRKLICNLESQKIM